MGSGVLLGVIGELKAQFHGWKHIIDRRIQSFAVAQGFNECGGFSIETLRHVFWSFASGYLFEHQPVFVVTAQRSLRAERASDHGPETVSEKLICFFHDTHGWQNIDPALNPVLELKI